MKGSQTGHSLFSHLNSICREMGIWPSKEPPPPKVLVPPLFDFPPLAVRTRMLESSYNMSFGKLALRCLFEDYFEEARRFNWRIMLKPIDDPHVDLVANVSGPLDLVPEDKFTGDAQFRWQSDIDDPNTFVDMFVSNSKPILQMRLSAYYPRFGVGAFTILPLILKKRVSPEDYGAMGLRYDSELFSFGLTVAPYPKPQEFLRSTWLVSNIGRLTAGVRFEPLYGNIYGPRMRNLRNWSCSIAYGVGSSSPLSPSFNFGLELVRCSLLGEYNDFPYELLMALAGSFCPFFHFVASFYQHFAVQRRMKRLLGENEIVGITNYIEVGFELQTRVDDAPTPNSISDSSFQIAASWQANENFLLKGKIGNVKSSFSMAVKSWWKPSFTCSVSATWDRTVGSTSFGVGIRIENLRDASYHKADSKTHIMVAPIREHPEKSLQSSDAKPINYLRRN